MQVMPARMSELGTTSALAAWILPVLVMSAQTVLVKRAPV